MNLSLLKEVLASFLRTRRIARHFRRLAMLESLSQTGVSRKVPATLAQARVAAAKSDTSSLLKALETHAAGLTESQADTIRERG
ncbi:hypothetical protein ACYZT9_17185 [Pseudomonas sp. ZT5P21]